MNKQPLSDYPRPQFYRYSYKSLNGFWDYKISKSAEIPIDFDFRNETNGAFGCYITHKWVDYKFKLTGYAKRYAKNRIFGKNQTIQDNTDGSILLTFTSNQDVPILKKVLGWGKECTVLSPQDFVEKWKHQIN